MQNGFSKKKKLKKPHKKTVTLSMRTTDLIQEIKRLPLTKKFYVVEETIKAIKKEEMIQQMELAANEFIDDYKNDNDLKVFTSLDFEGFYEAR